MRINQIPDDTEIIGRNIYMVLKGFHSFGLLASRFLLEQGIGVDDGAGMARIEKDWYSLKSFLRAFEKIGEQMGDGVLFNVGAEVPRTAVFPPDITDIESALRSIDVAYHMSHRRGGKVMFDPATGQKMMGIGNYVYEKVQGQHKALLICPNPYPCAFDRGIFTTMARRFNPTAQVVHDDSKPCRKKGGESCTYVVTWR